MIPSAWRFDWIWAPIAVALCAAVDLEPPIPTFAAVAKPESADEEAWKIFGPSLEHFHGGGSRTQFLATCKQLLRQFPGSSYETELSSLVRAMERESLAGRPAFLDKPPAERTREETIRYWIYQLRDLARKPSGNPGILMLFAIDEPPNAADQIVALGSAAIPLLIETLQDDTPTRTIAWQRSYYPVRFVLRRQDVAMKCLERIAGCRFYEEGTSFIHLYMDKPERRATAIATVHEWWAKSQGQSQAAGIRHQIALRGLSVAALDALAVLEGPESVIDDARWLLANSKPDLNSPIGELLDRLEPQTPIRAAFQRFKENRSGNGDYRYLLKYGDRATYEEMARRFSVTGRLDPDWNLGDQAHRAAQYGQNWAIPILGKLLEYSNPTGGRFVNEAVSEADYALEEFQTLTGRDFGYRPEKSMTERLAAIGKARDWWQQEGRSALEGKIAADHPPVAVWSSDEQIAGLEAALQSRDAEARRRTVASIEGVGSYRLQRAVLNALEIEENSAERAKLLSRLEKHPALWHLPSLVRLMEGDSVLADRVRVAQVIRTIIDDKPRPYLWLRLETRDQALNSARRLARSLETPGELRRAAADILIAWGSFQDEPMLRTLAADIVFKDFTPLQTFIRNQDEMAKRAVRQRFDE